MSGSFPVLSDSGDIDKAIKFFRTSILSCLTLITSFCLEGVVIGGVTICRMLLFALSPSDSSAHNSYESLLSSNMRELFLKRMTLPCCYLIRVRFCCLLSRLTNWILEICELLTPMQLPWTEGGKTSCKSSLPPEVTSLTGSLFCY